MTPIGGRVADYSKDAFQGDRGRRNTFLQVDKPNVRKEVDTTDDSTIYTGWAVIGTATSEAKWKIKRTVIAGSLITDTWADGDIEYDNVWDDRASLSYS